jgi:hypothetical protein
VLELDRPPGRFAVDAGVPYFEAQDDTEALVRYRLAEVERGLFLADNGETLDLRGQAPTWRNLRIVRVSGGPSGWQWAIVGAAALLALAWIVAAVARAVRRSAGQATAARVPRAFAAGVAAITALLLLATLALLAWKPGLVDAGFLGWLDVSPLVRLALHMPLAVAVLSICTAAFVAWGSLGRWWSRAVTLQYLSLAVAGIGVASLLAGWHLIGWGLT